MDALVGAQIMMGLRRTKMIADRITVQGIEYIKISSAEMQTIKDEAYKRGKRAAEAQLKPVMEMLHTKVYEQGIKDGMGLLISGLEEIDPCEFASYTLCLVREVAEEKQRSIEVEKNQ